MPCGTCGGKKKKAQQQQQADQKRTQQQPGSARQTTLRGPSAPGYTWNPPQPEQEG